MVVLGCVVILGRVCDHAALVTLAGDSHSLLDGSNWEGVRSDSARVDHPVASFASLRCLGGASVIDVCNAARHLDKELVEREIVSHRVLPALTVGSIELVEIRIGVAYPCIDLAQGHLAFGRGSDGLCDQARVAERWSTPLATDSAVGGRAFILRSSCSYSVPERRSGARLGF